MSEKARLHINRGVNRRYWLQTRERGCRRWIPSPFRRSYAAALRDLISVINAGRTFKRARILMAADYYDPISLLDMVKP